jgi:hypothetical protein
LRANGAESFVIQQRPKNPFDELIFQVILRLFQLNVGCQPVADERVCKITMTAKKCLRSENAHDI